MPIDPQKLKQFQQGFNNALGGQVAPPDQTFASVPPAAAPSPTPVQEQAAPVAPIAPPNPSILEIIKEKLANPALGSADLNLDKQRKLEALKKLSGN